ncbi:MAG: NAD(P)H-hydrate dehydratase [Candidatus Omnitrophica bacterium]|nr:NAD(P)H-hydrate dehydratase [Candidatus Omnitrophota bacterium]
MSKRVSLRGPKGRSNLDFRFLWRRSNTHKGDYGHVLVIGGSVGMTGAPILCAEAALRSGAGLVSLVVPKAIYPIIARKAAAEIMVHPQPVPASLYRKADVIALGPGLSRKPAAKTLVRRLLARTTQPVVIDADGIAALKGMKFLRRAGGAVITPHPGEMALLLGTTVRAVQADRKAVALKTAKRLGAVVVLKGHRTVIASPEGQMHVNTTGNPGMATAGMGDVLTGVIAALIGQGMEPFAAAKAGATVHGLAGDLAVKHIGEISLLAGDVLNELPNAFRKIQSSLPA